MQRQNPHRDVADLIDQMKCAAIRHDLKAIDACGDSLFMLTAAFMLPEVKYEYDVHLSNQEYRVIELLRRRAGRVLSKEQILCGVYFDRPDCDWAEERIVDVFVCRLRKKLERSGHEIETVLGLGYRYKQEADA